MIYYIITNLSSHTGQESVDTHFYKSVPEGLMRQKAQVDPRRWVKTWGKKIVTGPRSMSPKERKHTPGPSNGSKRKNVL